ncbi:hypothetical protein WG66_003874 [Moniliophthora roreri]|nr:hypothetical protein WG66_003874 [Moniliophthora roreri]
MTYPCHSVNWVQWWFGTESSLIIDQTFTTTARLLKPLVSYLQSGCAAAESTSLENWLSYLPAD